MVTAARKGGVAVEMFLGGSPKKRFDKAVKRSNGSVFKIDGPPNERECLISFWGSDDLSATDQDAEVERVLQAIGSRFAVENRGGFWSVKFD